MTRQAWQDIAMPLHTPHTPWNPTEVQATVRSYLDMLVQELAGQRYNKSACRQLLFDALAGGRSHASIEFKYCNISAVLQLLHYPSINGYKRRLNFQKSLMQEVERQIPLYPQLSAIVQAAVEQPAAEPMAPKFEQALQSPPSKTHQVSEALAQYAVRSPVKRDYLAQEARNQSLGLAGEQFAVAYEQWRLHRQGLPGLALRVEHVSQTLGDGLGFDIRSFDAQGNEQMIEVKTTRFAKDTPFFVSRNELDVSQQAAERFHLYRIFEFRQQPKLFTLKGAITEHCQLDPVTFRACF